MIGKVSADSATVHMVAGNGCAAETLFRLMLNDTQYGSVQSGLTAHDALVYDITGLSSDTYYAYRVETSKDGGSTWNGVSENDCSFHTQRSPGNGFTFCIAGDTHIYPAPYGFRQPNMRDVSFREYSCR